MADEAAQSDGLDGIRPGDAIELLRWAYPDGLPKG